MKEVRITAVKKSFYKDLFDKYQENKDLGCDIEEGDVWISREGERPLNFCESAWSNLYPYVFALSSGGGTFFGDWMKNPHSAVISCNDGIRPVSFLLETIE